MKDSLEDLAQRLDSFAREREWQQFHSPKNLASALIVEAGELLEHFQWMTEEQSRQLAPEKANAIGAEVADVLLYLIQLSAAIGIDPIAAAQAKLRLNEIRYPVERSRGSSKKHDELCSGPLDRATMIIYQATKTQFLQHAFADDIEDVVSRHFRIALRPDSDRPGYEPIVIEVGEEDESFAVVAELLMVLEAGQQAQ